MKTQNGYVALMTVIVVGAISSAIVVSLLTFSIIYNKNSITKNNSQTALSYAESCAEEALRLVRLKTYSASGSLDINGDTVDDCNYSVTGSAPSLTITSSNIPNSSILSVKKLQIITSAVSPRINILSWKEVP